jgi:hypothetical protein
VAAAAAAAIAAAAAAKRQQTHMPNMLHKPRAPATLAATIKTPAAPRLGAQQQQQQQQQSISRHTSQHAAKAQRTSHTGGNDQHTSSLKT